MYTCSFHGLIGPRRKIHRLFRRAVSACSNYSHAPVSFFFNNEAYVPLQKKQKQKSSELFGIESVSEREAQVNGCPTLQRITNRHFINLREKSDLRHVWRVAERDGESEEARKRERGEGESGKERIGEDRIAQVAQYAANECSIVNNDCRLRVIIEMIDIAYVLWKLYAHLIVRLSDACKTTAFLNEIKIRDQSK